MTNAVRSTGHNIDLRTLGAVDVCRNGQALQQLLVQQKRVALLCYLAIARPRGFHRRDTLVGVFWPELDQRRARAALRQALHHLRRAVGDHVVRTRGAEEVGLDFDYIRCDAVAFDAAVDRGDADEAVKAYGGSLLPGFALTNAAEFERWLESERDRLARRYARALRTMAEAAADTGDWQEAVTLLRRLTAHDPYTSEVALQLMVALDAAGDRVGAIAHAEAHATLLRREFQMEPDAAVTEFAVRLRSVNRTSDGAARTSRSRTPSSPPDAPLTAVTSPPSPPVRTKWPWRTLVATVTAAVSLIALFAVQRLLTAESSATVSLAVLPFENLAGEEYAYLAAGLTEDLVGRLGGVHQLAVVGPNDGSLETRRTWVAGGVGVNTEFALRGTAEQRDTMVRITPSLVRRRDGVRLWTETFEVPNEQLLRVQGQIAEEVSRQLDIALLSTEREWLHNVPTENVEAYNLYLRGAQRLASKPIGRANATAAIDMLERATALDSGFALAYAKLAIAHTSMFWWSYDRTDDRLSKAASAANHAVRLQPDSPNSHLALGWYHYWGRHDYDRALRHFELVRATSPGLTDVLVLIGAIRRRQGDLEQALIHQEEASRTNPACPICATEAAVTHFMLRDYHGAERDVHHALRLAPSLDYPRSLAAMLALNSGDYSRAREDAPTPETADDLIRLATGPWAILVRVLAAEFNAPLANLDLSAAVSDTAGFYLVKANLARRTGLPDVARAHYDSARYVLERAKLERPRDPLVRGRLGLAYAGLGRSDDAVREGTAAVRLRSVADDAVDGPLVLETLARIFSMLGEHDAALERLEILLSVPSLTSKELVRIDPAWADLRDNPRFERLTR
jgi:DNA-binding SARP family transcriptional activator/TolB-like protein